MLLLFLSLDTTAHLRGVDVKIVYDNKPKGASEESNPLIDQVRVGVYVFIGCLRLNQLYQHGIRSLVIPRCDSPRAISHNKFMVLLHCGCPIRVWTGSTNITEGNNSMKAKLHGLDLLLFQEEFSVKAMWGILFVTRAQHWNITPIGGG